MRYKSAAVKSHTPRKLLFICFLVLACLFVIDGLWIHLKAELAQVLIANAWAKTVATGKTSKPWPWADTWPIAQLYFPDSDVDLYILYGTTGNALAFAPGFMPGSALPGAEGTTVIAAHRDTHFSVLKMLVKGDEFHLNTPIASYRYTIDHIEVVDSSRQYLAIDENRATVKLITCYPFDSYQAGGDLRYVVKASKI